MRLSTLAISAAMALAVGLPAAVFAADGNCPRIPRSEWLSLAKISAKATEMGYAVRKIETDDGCYEVYASKGGELFEIYFNPGTAAIVKLEREDDRSSQRSWDDDDHDDDDDRHRRGRGEDDDRYDD